MKKPVRNHVVTIAIQTNISVRGLADSLFNDGQGRRATYRREPLQSFSGPKIADDRAHGLRGTGTLDSIVHLGKRSFGERAGERLLAEPNKLLDG
jgi:hypothetical protein